MFEMMSEKERREMLIREVTTVQRLDGRELERLAPEELTHHVFTGGVSTHLSSVVFYQKLIT